MKLGSLFDGIGGALLCAKRIGITPVWASEIEAFPIKVTQHHFPEVKHYGDITKMDGAAIEPVDIIIGGSPCQDLSQAGKRAGLQGERSGLFMEMIRVIKEMREATNNEQPRYMVWENVPGAFSSNGGEDFRAVLEETARIAEETISILGPPEWRNAGSVLGNDFSISWRTIDAQYWGVPQRRRRIYLVADFGGQSAPEILFESESLQGNPTESKSKGQGVAENAEGSFGKASGFDGYNAQVTGDKSATLGVNCGMTTGRNGVIERCVNSAEPVAFFSNSGFCNYLPDTVAATQRACVAKQTDVDLVTYQKVTGCSDCGISKGVSNQIAMNDMFVADSKQVCRLTPLECERLQGYPDGWTDMGSDTARYKALGNSFAIPCALFVIRGIYEKVQKQADHA